MHYPERIRVFTGTMSLELFILVSLRFAAHRPVGA